jgi:hypothetical protein
VAIAALVISLVSILIAGLSVWYAHRADQRAGRAEERAERAEQRAEQADRRDAARFAGQQADTELAALNRVAGIMNRELAAAVEATATDPQAFRRVHAAQSRLEQAIAATGHDLPTCAKYAKTTDAALLPEAERELGQARAAIRPYRQ